MITDMGDIAHALTFKEAPDYEIPCETRAGTTCMNVTVKVTDDGTGVGNKMTAMQDVTVIMVTNVEENSGRSTLIDPAASKVGFPVTATLADQDNVTVRVQRCYLAVGERQRTMIILVENTEDDEVDRGRHDGDLCADQLLRQQLCLRAIATYTDGKGKDTSMATTVAAVEHEDGYPADVR